ncbi:hypothetical protein [Streptomyces sp. NPDC017958]|uniref:hypothetical protein n=1 Tax=Streptomyces sp. NPDC017958 TaxID=3365021 RepID=UPI00379404A2
MTQRLWLALVVPILIAECIAQFVFHNQAWTSVLALLNLAVIAVRWALGPQAAEECAADCPKCAEDESA